MRLHEGDQVTVQPIESDPYILHFQRYATIERRTDRGYLIRIDGAVPPVYGPIPETRLLPGWRDADGAFRRW